MRLSQNLLFRIETIFAFSIAVHLLSRSVLLHVVVLFHIPIRYGGAEHTCCRKGEKCSFLESFIDFFPLKLTWIKPREVNLVFTDLLKFCLLKSIQHSRQKVSFIKWNIESRHGSVKRVTFQALPLKEAYSSRGATAAPPRPCSRKLHF